MVRAEGGPDTSIAKENRHPASPRDHLVEVTGSPKSPSLRRVLSLIDPNVLNHHLFKKLAVDRCGDVPGSHMKTKNLDLLVDPGVTYEFDFEKGIKIVDASTHEAPIRTFRSPDLSGPPSFPHARFTGVWDKTVAVKDDSNILGGNGSLHVSTHEAEIKVPVVEATEETLSYFKAHLLKPGDQFRFQTHQRFPIFTMEIGEHYVPEYIMEKGNGLYLEYHDEPHFHQPMDRAAGGVYVLAKKVGIEGHQDIFHMTAFKIPYGYAVYSEPGAIHDDAPTQGNWRVGYIDALNFSTVILKNDENRPVGMKFEHI
jgi:hypothetical protein